MMKNELQSKTYTVTEQLAKVFISLPLHSRILGVSELSRMLDVAQGTVQLGLKILKDYQAVKLSSHGKMGTYLVDKDLTKLLEFAGLSYLVGVMPLPYTKLYEGLSSGLILTLDQHLQVSLTMAYIRGALKRIELVSLRRYDFAVVSKFAANEYIKQHPDKIEICCEFPKYSYLKGHCIYFASAMDTELRPGMKVALDKDSIDQRMMTERVCAGLPVTFVPINYTMILEKLKSKEIDAAIFNQDESWLNYNSKPIEIEDEDNTIAVLVVSKNRPEIKSLLQQSMDINQVMNIQLEVILGKRIPQY